MDCVICGKFYFGTIRKAEPIRKGFCCLNCYLHKVLPAKNKQKEKEGKQ